MCCNYVASTSGASFWHYPEFFYEAVIAAQWYCMENSRRAGTEPKAAWRCTGQVCFKGAGDVNPAGFLFKFSGGCTSATVVSAAYVIRPSFPPLQNHLLSYLQTSISRLSFASGQFGLAIRCAVLFSIIYIYAVVSIRSNSEHLFPIFCRQSGFSTFFPNFNMSYVISRRSFPSSGKCLHRRMHHPLLYHLHLFSCSNPLGQ